MKKPDESYLEYRKRVIDSVSPSFCAAKWLNATIWLGSGRTASCHHPPPHGIPPESVKNNPKALHNTEHKKNMRALMLAGKRPPECEYCWKIEDIQRENISDRVFKTVIYPEEDIQRIAKLEPSEDVELRTLEIAFDRICNFACSYCNPTYSTRWAQDIDKNGPYEGLVTEGGVYYTNDAKWADPYVDAESNPYIQAFWKWWPELSKSLQELRVTGGEPLMSPEVWKFFDFFKNNHANQMLFSMNSNLGAPQKLIDRLVEASHYVKNFDIYTSCEATGAQAEYIRDGLEYERYIRNVEKLLQQGNIRQLNFMMTINSLCLYSITDFLDWLLALKSHYGKAKIYWSVNILRSPHFMSPLNLPDHLKEERRFHLVDWFSGHKHHSMMDEMERDSVQRLIDYLEVVKEPHYSKTSSKSYLWPDFRRFYEQYDKRRGKDIRKAFPPVFVEWYDSIQPS